VANIFISVYLLKEYRNRWFIFGKQKGKKELLTLALDRIIDLSESKTDEYEENINIDFTTYFNDIIGVTKNNKPAQLIIFQVNSEHAPYVITKPFHYSQKVLDENSTGTVFSIQVIPNVELEKEILAHGANIEVLAPEKFRNLIKIKIQDAWKVYE